MDPTEALLGAASRRCADCSSVATFGPPDAYNGRDGSKLRCAKHRRAGDIDLRNRRCEAEMTGWDMQHERPATFSCPHRASFGNPAEGLRRFCSLHKGKLDTNLNLKKTCSAEGCYLTPSFCDPSTRRAQYCSRHRPEGFVHRSMLPVSKDSANVRHWTTRRPSDFSWENSATCSQQLRGSAEDMK